MKKWEIWMEGNGAQGNAGPAQLIGRHLAETFDKAVRQYAKENPDTTIDWDRFGKGRHAIWACELFDNEEDARKAFG